MHEDKQILLNEEVMSCNTIFQKLFREINAAFPI